MDPAQARSGHVEAGIRNHPCLDRQEDARRVRRLSVTMGVVADGGSVCRVLSVGSFEGCGFCLGSRAKHRNNAFFVLCSHLATSTCGVQRLCCSLL